MLNVVAIMGRLARDPEMRQTTTGKNVASFRIACDRGRRDANGQSVADWIDVVAWDRQAEFVLFAGVVGPAEMRVFARGAIVLIPEAGSRNRRSAHFQVFEQEASRRGDRHGVGAEQVGFGKKLGAKRKA